MFLITGGGGFIGVNCALHFVEAGHDVVLVDQEPAGRSIERELGPGFNFEPVDVLDLAALDRVVRRHRVTGIVHLAAPIGLAVSAEDYMLAAATMMRNVVQTAVAAGVKRITTASSIAVYFGVKQGPYREEEGLPVPSPTRITAIKKADELIADLVTRSGSLEVISLRLANIYGPRYRSMFNAPSRLCHAALGRSLPPAPEHGAPDIIALAQDYCYVADCVRAIEMVQTAPRLKHSIYNVGSGSGARDEDIAAAVRLAVRGADGSPGATISNAASYYLDLSRIRTDIGFEPQYDLRRGVAAYLAWLRTHEY